jgi:hypothetical protein
LSLALFLRNRHQEAQAIQNNSSSKEAVLVGFFREIFGVTTTSSSSSSSSPKVSEGREDQTFVDFELSFLADVVFLRGAGTGALIEIKGIVNRSCMADIN